MSKTDHDREKPHNWIADANKQLLLWDSGLAFAHGPRGKESCLNILCGPDRWRVDSDKSPSKQDQKPCRRICRFRESTVRKLSEMATRNATALSNGQTVGTLFRAALKADLIHPVLRFPLYYTSLSGYPKIHFPEEEFAIGLDTKVDRLLVHIDDCLRQYGADRVILR